MSRLEKTREGFEGLVSRCETSSGKSKRQVLEDLSQELEDSLREHEGIEFTGKNWGLVMKLVVLDDMIMDLQKSN
jgi:hypothetical protein